MTAASPRVVIAAGGTGGHMFPAQALAEELLARGWRVSLSTDPRGARYAGGFPDAVVREHVASATFARGGALAKLGVPFKIAAGVLAAMRGFRRDRPAVVIGFGGYPSIPALVAAWLLGLPRMIHEQNGVLGRVNQLLARRVDHVACGTWPTALPDGVEGTHIGNPVRAVILENMDVPYSPPGDGPLNILVFGGSQGARVMSDHVPPAILALPEDLRHRIRLTQQARPEDVERVKTAYEAASIPADIRSFIDDLPECLAAAQLVIARSGASSVADICAIGRPSILIPLATAIRDEQTANATGLSQSGGGMVIQESHLQQAVLTTAIAEVLKDPQKAQSMAQAAKELGRPNAASHLADHVEALAKGRQS